MKNLLLILESDKTVLSCLSTILVEEGYDVLATDNVHRAVSMFEQCNLSLVVIDQHFLETSFDILDKTISERNNSIPILLTTCYCMLEETRKWREKYSLTCLERPINFDSFLGTVKSKLAMNLK